MAANWEAKVAELQRALARHKETVRLWREFQPMFTQFLLDLLQVVDNFDRALESMESSHSVAAILEGVQATRRQMLDVLARRDIHPFDPVGMEYSPAFHEVLEPSELELTDQPVVVGVLRAGYRIGEQVLRKPWVRVGSSDSVSSPAD